MNIIEFFDRTLFKKRSIRLHPMQQVILKLIYGLALTDSEAELAAVNGLPTSNINYRQVVGILGRRTGKDFLLAIIAAYEIYNLIELGTPYSHYQVGTGSPITILAVAASTEQGRILFNEIHNTVSHCSYFKNLWKSPRRGVLTFRAKEADVEIRIGSAGSEGLVGTNAHTLLFSEMAVYRDQEIMSTLLPTTAIFQGKTIIFSTPRDANDLLYQLYSDPQPYRLTFALPTWVVNPTLGAAALRYQNGHMNDQGFWREFGARFNNVPVAVQAAAETEQCEKEEEGGIITKHTHSYPFSRQLDLEE